MDPKRLAARYLAAAGYHHTEGERFWGRAGAGALLKAADTGRVLLVKRSPHVEQPGTWSAPGGALEDGETPAQAAINELREEVGYRGQVKLVPGFVFRKGSFSYFNFWGVVPNEFNARLNWENSQSGWFDLNDLPSPLHPGIKAFLAHDAKSIAKTASYDEYNLLSIVEIFAGQAHYPIGTCDMNRGDCETMSNVLLDWFSTVTLPDGFEDLARDLKRAHLMAGVGFKKPLGHDSIWEGFSPDALTHVVVHVGPWVVDMTGKQFGSKYADPIYPFTTFKQRWETVKRVSRGSAQVNALRWQMLQSGGSW